MFTGPTVTMSNVGEPIRTVAVAPCQTVHGKPGRFIEPSQSSAAALPGTPRSSYPLADSGLPLHDARQRPAATAAMSVGPDTAEFSVSKGPLMNNRSLYRRARTPLSLLATATVAAALFAASVVPASAGRATSSRHRKPTVVLVHGAFAASTSWNDVVKKLKRDGYPVIAAADPLRGLSSNTAYIKDFLASIDGPVVLAGQSYGGSVISDTAYGADNVKALVFIAAFLPEKGESAFELSGKFPGSS